MKTLVVDRFPRVGDNWRTRYETLALHNKTDMCHFPYMPFPYSFPEHLPKDKVADWIAAYVEAMEVNYWTSTEFYGGEYLEELESWRVDVRRADGTVRTMYPKHVVITTGGVGGRPNIPSLPEIDSFEGEVLHTKEFRSGEDFVGRRVLVVGVGTSGHDTVCALRYHWADVTMMQRGPVAVVNMDSANMCYPTVYADGTPLEEADLIGMAGFVYPLLTAGFRQLGAMVAERDKSLPDALAAVGMQIDNDERGWVWKFYEEFSGYYINVGASELVAKGEIALIQAKDASVFVPDGLTMTDGSKLPFDAVVLATGYHNQQLEMEHFFGADVAAKVGRIGGFDEVGELRNAFKPTAQPGLRFATSRFASGRSLAPHMAAMIKGQLEGFAPKKRHGFIAEVGGTHFNSR
nr:SidA/IucD/PvdA family monooxygenase [Rhodococcus erythropolis]